METASGILARTCAALHIDVEDQVEVHGQGVVERQAGRAIKAAEDLRVLQKHPGIGHAQKLFAGGEVIFAPVPLRSARRARGPGDGKIDGAHLLAQLAHQRAFAGARRRRDDE
jgi:hypothetical protein